MDAIDMIFTLRYYEQNTTGKTQEVAHALVYANETGRTSAKLEAAITNNVIGLIAEIEKQWNGEESTHGVLATMRQMGY